MLVMATKWLNHAIIASVMDTAVSTSTPANVSTAKQSLALAHRCTASSIVVVYAKGIIPASSHRSST